MDGASTPQPTGGSEFDDIFREYLDPVYRFMYRHVGNQEDAEDLTSEVFLSAAKHLDTARPQRAIGRWLFTVSRNAIADHWRRHYRAPPPLDIDAVQVAELSPQRKSSSHGERTLQRVEAVLGALPDRYRQVLELRFLHGYTLGETAQELGITIENVKVTQHRALAKAVLVADEQ